jgi:hypothetical protein
MSATSIPQSVTGIRGERERDPAAAIAFGIAGFVALLLGGIVATKVTLALGVIGFGLVVVLAFRAPVAHLLTLLVITAIVPLTWQARFGTGGNVNAAGVIPSDVFLLVGLARAFWTLRSERLDRRATLAAVLVVAFMGVDLLQLLHAHALGRPLSGGVGSEFRDLLGVGTLLMALPLLAREQSRRRLLRGLTGFALALGLWGIAQFALHLRFDTSGDFNPLPGSLLTGGRVVGMFLFPIAALVALAVLSSGRVRSTSSRLMLLLVILVNLAALALTFERTIVVTTAIGVVVLLLRAGARERARLVAWAPVAAIGVLVTLALAGPTVLTAFEKRITSLSAYKTDPSYIYRVEESRYVSERISEHPLTGSGLGASILIGRPGSNEPLAPRSYAENGYLWLAWKLGWPGAALLWALIALAIVWPGRRREDPLFNVVRRGIQVGLLVFALSTFVFGSLDSVENTPALGVLLAICAAPLVLPASRGRTVRP